MGIDRVIHDQKEKKRAQKKQPLQKKQNKTPIRETLENQPFDKKSEGTYQSQENKNNDNTVVTRSSEHQEKIDQIRSMLNLK